MNHVIVSLQLVFILINSCKSQKTTTECEKLISSGDFRNFLQDYGRFYHFSKYAAFVDGECYRSAFSRMGGSELMMSLVRLEKMERKFEEEITRVRHSLFNHQDILIILYTDTPQMWMDKVSDEKLFSVFSWLVVGKLPQSSFLQLRLPLNNLVTFGSVSSSGSLTLLEFHETYTVTVETPVSYSLTGYWSTVRGMKMPEKDRTDRRMNLLGAHFECVTEQQSPHIILDENPDGSWKVSGWLYDLQLTLEKFMNFTCHTAPSPDRQFGAVQKDGTWSGMVGQVYTGKADLIIAPLDNTVARSEAVKFLMAIDLTGFIMILKPTNTLGSVWTSYTTEFSYGVWACVVLLVMSGSFVYIVISRNHPTENLRLRSGEAFMVSLGAITAQSLPDTVTSLSGRIAHSTIFLASLLVSIHYSCWLYSSLTISNPVFPFDSFQSLLDEGSYTVGIIKGYSIETELKKSKDPTVQRVWNELVNPDGLVPNSEVGVQKALEDDFVFLIIDSEFYGIVDDPCDYMALPEKYFKFPTGMAVAHGSPLEAVFNRAIMMLIDNGVLARIKQQWEKRRPDCSDVGINPMTLKQMVSAFFLLAAGISFALLVLGLESCCNRKKRIKSARSLDVGYAWQWN